MISLVSTYKRKKRYLFVLHRLYIPVFFFSALFAHSQLRKERFSFGIAYGTGSELRDKDYTFTNRFYKVQVEYVFKEGRHFGYDLIVQPEINFGAHQLLNEYFVQPHEPDYASLREVYTKPKNIRDYVLNVGLKVRKSLSRNTSVYLLGSIGPMITDTETERLSKGFAFSDVIAVGFSVKTNAVRFDVRPGLQHVSNGGLYESNAGINTKNIEFSVSFLL